MVLKQAVTMWTGYMWLKMRGQWRTFVIWQWTLWFHKIRGGFLASWVTVSVSCSGTAMNMMQLMSLLIRSVSFSSRYHSMA